MTWVDLDQDWGLPAVNISIARYLLGTLPLLEALRTIEEGEASRGRVQEWLVKHVRGLYGGAQVCSMHISPHTDELLLTVLHPLFPRTKAFARLPCWHLMVHDADTKQPFFTIEELGT